MNSKLRKFTAADTIVYSLLALFSIACLYPFLMVIGGSLSTASDISQYGFQAIPKHFTLGSYKTVFINKEAIFNGYKITIFVTLVGTTVALLVNSLMAFVLARKNLKFRKFLNIFVLITILFNGGMVPWYIICVRYLHLKDTIIALILPSLVNAWNIFLIRNYFNSVPEEMYESAKIDGAGDFVIYRKIYFHLATPVLATVALFTALGYWNDWWLGLMLIDNTRLQPLQLLLRSIISNIEFLKSAQTTPEIQQMMASLPSDGIRMCMVVITIGPIIFVYPFVQKYFIKGIMIGAVKG